MSSDSVLLQIRKLALIDTVSLAITCVCFLIFLVSGSFDFSVPVGGGQEGEFYSQIARTSERLSKLNLKTLLK